MGSHFSGILRVRKFRQVIVYGKQMYQNVYSVVVKWLNCGRENYIYPKVTKMGSITGNRIWL